MFARLRILKRIIVNIGFAHLRSYSLLKAVEITFLICVQVELSLLLVLWSPYWVSYWDIALTAKSRSILDDVIGLPDPKGYLVYYTLRTKIVGSSSFDAVICFPVSGFSFPNIMIPV